MWKMETSSRKTQNNRGSAEEGRLERGILAGSAWLKKSESGKEKGD
jgi:hypothetical protein